MRRYRRRHKGIPKSKTKIIFRILFIILAATALTALSFWLGTYLKEKAIIATSQMTADSNDTEQTEPHTAEPQKLPDGILSESNASELKVCAADIDPTRFTNKQLSSFFDELPSDYNCISVRLTTDGKLVYASPALLNLVRISDTLHGIGTVEVTNESSDNNDTDNEENIDVFDNIKSIISISSNKGLRTSCIFETSSNVLEDANTSLIDKTIDKTIVEELCQTGFDEIIIDGLINAQSTLDFETLSKIINYMSFLREVSNGVDIGIMLPSSVYLDAPTANQIEALSKYADFLAISVSAENTASYNEVYNEVYDNCYLLKGNFSVYNMRAVINSDDAEISKAAYEALKNLSADNIQFSSYIDDLSIEEQSDNTNSDSHNDDGKTNNNASTKDKYSNQDNDDSNGE